MRKALRNTLGLLALMGAVTWFGMICGALFWLPATWAILLVCSLPLFLFVANLIDQNLHKILK